MIRSRDRDRGDEPVTPVKSRLGLVRPRNWSGGPFASFAVQFVLHE